jgi:hypothetical protein
VRTNFRNRFANCFGKGKCLWKRQAPIALQSKDTAKYFAKCLLPPCVAHNLQSWWPAESTLNAIDDMGVAAIEHRGKVNRRRAEFIPKIKGCRG